MKKVQQFLIFHRLLRIMYISSFRQWCLIISKLSRYYNVYFHVGRDRSPTLHIAKWRGVYQKNLSRDQNQEKWTKRIVRSSICCCQSCLLRNCILLQLNLAACNHVVLNFFWQNMIVSLSIQLKTVVTSYIPKTKRILLYDPARLWITALNMVGTTQANQLSLTHQPNWKPRGHMAKNRC